MHAKKIIMKSKKTLLAAVLIFIYFFNSSAQVPNQTGAGNCLSFNGTSNSVNYGIVTTTASSSTLPFTVSAWFNTTSTQIGCIVEKYQGISITGIFGWAIEVNTPTVGNLNFYLNNSQLADASVVYTGTPINDGNWHHLTAVYSATTGFLYIDGVLVATAATPGGSPNSRNLNSGNISIQNDQFFNGQIDEVRIWNRALTPTEVRDSMCTKLTGNETGLVGYWRFDEITGNTVFDSQTNVIANNGTGF